MALRQENNYKKNPIWKSIEAQFKENRYPSLMSYLNIETMRGKINSEDLYLSGNIKNTLFGKSTPSIEAPLDEYAIYKDPDLKPYIKKQ